MESIQLNAATRHLGSMMFQPAISLSGAWGNQQKRRYNYSHIHMKRAFQPHSDRHFPIPVAGENDAVDASVSLTYHPSKD